MFLYFEKYGGHPKHLSILRQFLMFMDLYREKQYPFYPLLQTFYRKSKVIVQIKKRWPMCQNMCIVLKALIQEA